MQDAREGGREGEMEVRGQYSGQWLGGLLVRRGRVLRGFRGRTEDSRRAHANGFPNTGTSASADTARRRNESARLRAGESVGRYGGGASP
jgi:hypothetical protein